MRTIEVAASIVLAACGGHAGTSSTAPPAAASRTSAEDDMMAAASAASAGDESAFGPLDVGADFRTYRRVTAEPFLSRAHGDRWVHVWVNAIGAEAYMVQGAPVPDGTIVVKESWLDDGGRPSSTPGPIYVMEKRPAGYLPEHGDWYVAIHWAKPVGKVARGGPIYWRGKSERLGFCFDCHDAYDRSLGGLIPSSALPR